MLRLSLLFYKLKTIKYNLPPYNILINNNYKHDKKTLVLAELIIPLIRDIPNAYFNYFRSNMDATNKEEKQPNPRSKANIFSIITFR